MRILDLCCGVGGAGMGYHTAGLGVIGVDIVKQKRYPFDFVQADAIKTLENLINDIPLNVYKTRDRLEQMYGVEEPTVYTLADFDFIHASPPCKLYTVANNVHKTQHSDIIEPLRQLLIATGKPYVIENVLLAPLINPVTICGLQLGLKVKRHRMFESNVPLQGTPTCDIHYGPWITIFGRAVRRGGTEIGFEAGKEAMGVTWCKSREELSQSIPPAYTRYIGAQLLS